MTLQIERPIFVVGAPRSGTTMLRYMLSSHPRIYIPPESNFIPRFFPFPSDEPLSREQAVDLIRATLQYKVFFRDWQGNLPQPAEFVDALSDKLPSTLLQSLYSQYAHQQNATRWGDKSPIYTSYVAEIAELFPDAQFVHIIRDGRDVSLSMLKAYQGIRFFYIDLCFAAQSWKQRVQKARSAGAALGTDRYFELNYEQLTAVPEPTLQNLCDFLGETYVPEMAAPHRVAGGQYHSTGIHAATRQPLTTKSTGRWRQEMLPSDQRLFQAMAGRFLLDLGYETVNLGRLSILEQVRLAGLLSKYTAVETGRRVLQTAGVVHPAALVTKVMKKRPFKWRKESFQKLKDLKGSLFSPYK